MSGLLFRAIIIVAVVLACAVGLTAAFALCVAADYFAFATILSPPWAALAAAGTALLFCALAVILGQFVLARMRARARKTFPFRIASVLGEVFGADLLEMADRYPTRSIAAALFVGFALGFSPKLRDALRGFLRR
ncbi:MAG TPA: hypothetical protein VGI20_12825 [Rhizomicrobium sp.]|jgi:hypothetical protein